MKFLVIGDIHFKLNNEEDTNYLIQFIHDTIQQNIDIHYVIVLGDILHTHERLHTLVMNRAIDAFITIAKMKPLFILVGNHDYINNSQFMSNHHWMNALKYIPNITIVDRLIEIKKGIYAIPYLPKGMLSNALKTIKDDIHLLFAHQEFRNCHMGPILSKDGDEWPSEGYVISGHIHDSQWVGNHIYYVGSALQHSLAENKKKHVALVSYDENNFNVTIKEIRVPIHIRKIYYVDSLTNKQIHDATYRDKIILQCSKETFKEIKLSKLYKDLCKKNIRIAWKETKNIQTMPTKSKISLRENVLQRIDIHPCRTHLFELYNEFVGQI